MDIIPGSSLGVDSILLTTFFVYGFVCWRFRVSYRISVGAGMIGLIGTSISVIIGQGQTAGVLATIAYYLLTVGVVLAIIEYRRRKEELVKVHKDSPTSARLLSSEVGLDALLSGSHWVQARRLPGSM